MMCFLDSNNKILQVCRVHLQRKNLRIFQIKKEVLKLGSWREQPTSVKPSPKGSEPFIFQEGHRGVFSEK